MCGVRGLHTHASSGGCPVSVFELIPYANIEIIARMLPSRPPSNPFARSIHFPRIALATVCFAAGAVFILAALVLWPSVYLGIADRVNWRLGRTAAGQIELEQTLIQLQLRGDAAAGDRATLIFGDSHLHGLPASALGDAVTNYAIGGEPASRLAERIGRYPSVRQARRIILLSGTNDLAAGVPPSVIAASIASAMQLVPHHTPVLLLEVPPAHVGTAAQGSRATLNQELARRCAARPGCHLLALAVLADPQDRLQARYAGSDGIHLSDAGYRALAGALNNALREISP